MRHTMDSSVVFSRTNRIRTLAALLSLAVFVICLERATAQGQSAGQLAQTAPQTAQPAATPPENPPQPPSLSELVRQAGENFSPPTEKQLADARAALNKEVSALEQYVKPYTQNGKLWLQYLKWDAFKKSFAADGQPDLGPLAETYQQLNRNEAGLELSRFRSLSGALRRYLDLLKVARMEDPATVYNRQLEALAADLERSRTKRLANTEFDLGWRLDFLTGLGQAPELVAAIRNEFVAPNAFVNVSENYISGGVGHAVNRSEAITDNILGTSINGHSHTTGTVETKILPSTDRARIQIVSKGHVTSNNTGRNGPAVIQSSGNANFTAAKLVELSDQAFRSQPARVNATYSSDIHSISKAGGGIGSRMVSSQGWSRARQNQGQVNAIAADHTEERIARRINDEVEKKLRDARKRYEDEYRKPLARRGDFPEHIQFATTADELTIVATQANRGQLGASSEPPALPAGHDVVVRLHDSAVNNYAASTVGGATASQTEPGQKRAKFDVELPKFMKDAWDRERTDEPKTGDGETFKPTTITFRQGRPVSVGFAENKVNLTIHVARLTSGDEEFEGWDITGVFTPNLEGGKVVLVREGDLVVLPTGFNTDGTEQLNSRQVAVRSNLTRVLNERSAQGRGFPSRMEIKELEPSGGLEKAGPLEAESVHSENGWLTVAWNRKK